MANHVIIIQKCAELAECSEARGLGPCLLHNSILIQIRPIWLDKTFH